MTRSHIARTGSEGDTPWSGVGVGEAPRWERRELGEGGAPQAVQALKGRKPLGGSGREADQLTDLLQPGSPE